MNRIKLAVIAGGALFAAPVLALDADPMADPSTDPAAENPADPGTGMEGTGMEGDTTGMEGTPTDATGAIPAVGWPPSAIDRPYLRGKGSITAGADFALTRISITDPMTGISAEATLDAFTLNGTYGITDQISAGALYSISFGLGDTDFEVVGPLTLWGGYQILHKSNLSVAATAAYSINLDNTDDMGISAGLGAKYLLSPKMAVFTGGPFGPVSSGGLLGAGPVGNHLNISLEDSGPITFDVPVGFGFQATPQLYAFATTQLASLSISNSDSTFIFADYIPLGLGALFSVNKNIDVAGNFTFGDLKNGVDVFAFTIGARWYN